LHLSYRSASSRWLYAAQLSAVTVTMSDDEYDSKTGMSREVTKQNRMVYRKTPNPKDFSRCRAPKLSMWMYCLWEYKYGHPSQR
jgi:hypothetical protein